MEASVSLEECVIKVENEVKPDDEEDGLDETILGDGGIPVKGNTKSVKEEEEFENEIQAPSAVNVNTIKEEALSDEEVLDPPVEVTVEDFKEDVPEGFYNKILPGGASNHASASTSGAKMSLQLQGNAHGGETRISHDMTGTMVHPQHSSAATIPSSVLSFVSADRPDFQAGESTLVEDGGVQYVYIAPADSFYFVEGGENSAMSQSEGNVTFMGNDVLASNIMVGKSGLPGDTFPDNAATGRNESTRKHEGEDVTMISTGTVLKRNKNEIESTSKGQSEVSKTSQRKRAKVRNAGESNKRVSKKSQAELENLLKKSCPVGQCNANCCTEISEQYRRKICKAFLSLDEQDKKMFMLQRCSREVAETVIGDNKITHFKFSFHLGVESGKLVRVCKSFFSSTLGFSEREFDAYLASTFTIRVPGPSQSVSNEATQGTTETDNTSQKIAGIVKYFADESEVHKHYVHNHLEGFLKTVLLSNGESTRVVRYLPKDVSIMMMYEDFCQKYPQILNTYEWYRNVVVNFTT